MTAGTTHHAPRAQPPLPVTHSHPLSGLCQDSRRNTRLETLAGPYKLSVSITLKNQTVKPKQLFLPFLLPPLLVLYLK